MGVLGPGTGNYFPTFWQTISMTLGLSLGTIGLPHLLLRFYTNPSAKAARRSALMAIGIASVFFLFAVYLGVVGRAIFIKGEASSQVMSDLITGGNNMVVPSTAQALGGGMDARSCYRWCLCCHFLKFVRAIHRKLWSTCS
ncbi:hypothetical protein RCO48_18535 [Peribacillus frigoritolerans]|nr:hypothetical protein [Peribacillus frigoritolerans]